ncbi:hypothetical protein BDV06DRAFT_227327 [Aspergillus oleicola]
MTDLEPVGHNQEAPGLYRIKICAVNQVKQSTCHKTPNINHLAATIATQIYGRSKAELCKPTKSKIGNWTHEYHATSDCHTSAKLLDLAGSLYLHMYEKLDKFLPCASPHRAILSL